jgi:hypothetical protein
MKTSIIELFTCGMVISSDAQFLLGSSVLKPCSPSLIRNQAHATEHYRIADNFFFYLDIGQLGQVPSKTTAGTIPAIAAHRRTHVAVSAAFHIPSRRRLDVFLTRRMWLMRPPTSGRHIAVAVWSIMLCKPTYILIRSLA